MTGPEASVPNGTTGVRGGLFAWLRQLAVLTGTPGAAPGPLGTAEIPRIGLGAAAPGWAFPYLVTRRADRVDGRTLVAQGDVRFATFELEFCDNDAARLAMLVEAFTPALPGLDGAWGSVWIRSQGQIGELDTVDEAGDGSGAWWYCTVVTVRVSYKANPTRPT